MKKLIKIVGIIVIVLGVIYGSYLLFVVPNGFTSEEAAVASFITNMDDNNTCSEHFYSETTDICEFLVLELGSKEVEFTSGVKTSEGMDITLTIDTIEVDFEVTFYEYEPSGLRSFFNSEYYLIETIE